MIGMRLISFHAIFVAFILKRIFASWFALFLGYAFELFHFGWFEVVCLLITTQKMTFLLVKTFSHNFFNANLS